jgi:hypothetical protein
MSSKYVHRMTLFKIPNKEDQEKVLEKYKTVKDVALKVLVVQTQRLPKI